MIGSAHGQSRRHSRDTSIAFRADIQGLRGIAVGLVVAYHAGLPMLPAGYVGVDVFFVISGFLITTLLVAEMERSGTISLPRFYARRARRLLPAAAVVLAMTVVLVRLVVPKARWEDIGGDVVGAALYVVNWRLADRSVDYLAEDSKPSPVQHFWSLAVEEQFYLVWPLLILLIAYLAASARIRIRPALGIGIAVIAVPSFAWAVVHTAESPASAFFVTTTRMWQLAVGAAVALSAAVLVRLPGRVAGLAGWAGAVAIAVSAVVFHTGTPWPGVAAALPTLGAAAVIAGGCVRSAGGPGALLAARPLRRLGDLSYSLYLWHWPLIAVATAYWPGLSTPHRVLVAVASLLPAWLTHRLVENPIRYAPTVSVSYRRALAVGGGCTVVGVAAGAVLLGMVAGAVGAGGAGAGSALGAAVLAADPRDDPAGRAPDRVDHVTPDPLRATADVPDVYADGCHQDQRGVEVVSCTYGNVASGVSVAVAGDSKVAQWLPALQLLADHNNWRLTTYTKSACSMSDAMIKDGDGRPYASCREWTERVVRHLTTVDVPDYVITSQGANRAFGATGDLSADALAAGLERSWTALVRAGASVIVVADNPHPGFTVYECVTEHADRLSSCTYSRERRRSHGGYAVQRQVVARQPAIRMVDLFDAICPVEPCSPVIGNVLIYRQGSHLTSTYVKTLTPRLAAALSDAGLPAAYGDSDRYRRWHD